MDVSLLDIAVSTGVAKAGMTIGHVFTECVMHNVPGIPYCDENNKVIGRISIRHTLKVSSTPGYMVGAAHLLGDDIWHLSTSKIEARKLLDMPAEKFVLENIAIVTAASPIVKAMAIMEKYNTGYVFLIDEGVYEGIVTRMGIAKLMLKTEIL